MDRIVFTLLGSAASSTHAAAATLLQVLAASGSDVWDGADWEGEPPGASRADLPGRLLTIFLAGLFWSEHNPR